MRTKTVKIANKNIVIQEKTIGQIKKLATEINIDFNNFLKTDLEGKNTADIAGLVFNLVENKATQIFPELTSEDIENSYPSELEELIGGFMDVNFSAMKKVFVKATNMM